MTQRRSRRRGRRGEAPAITDTGRYRNLASPYEPLALLSADQVVQIHDSALSVLEETGIRVLEPESRAIFREAGINVDESSQITRFDRHVVEVAVDHCPAEFWMRSRDGNRDFHVGGRSVAFLPVAGPPHATDIERGRRAGSLADFQEFTRLTQAYDVLHALTPCVEPQDVALQERHLEMTHTQLRLSDKVPFIYARGRAQVADCLEMIRIASDMDDAEFAAEPRTWTVINSNSPRQLDISMCQGIIDFARRGQALIITPFTLSGAMAPVSLAGALVLQHAEALAGITLAQLVKPGAPVVYGAFTSNVDMRSGAPAFGTPEAYKAAIASGQLARHLRIPWRSSGVNTSNVPDAQSGYETMVNMTGAIQGGANWIIHAAGWLESGLSASYEKFVLDVEMCQIIAETMVPIEVNDAELGTDAIAGVDPGGHFFGTEHTLQRFRTAFYEPVVFDRSNFEQWTEDGSRTSLDRAHKVWQKTLVRFTPPALPDQVAAELDEYVGRRKHEGGALPDA